jgi:hypothetical protein
MDFIAARRLFNHEWIICGRENVFITRKAWKRTATKNGKAYFWMLCIDVLLHHCRFKTDKHGKPAGDPLALSEDDYNACDWAVFDIDCWETREDE